MKAYIKENICFGSADLTYPGAIQDFPGGEGAQKIMLAHAHHEREAQSPLRPGQSVLIERVATPEVSADWSLHKRVPPHHRSR